MQTVPVKERRDHSRPFLETSRHRPRLADKCGTIGRENQRVIKIILRLVDIEITNSKVAFSGQKENWKMQLTDRLVLSLTRWK